MKKVFFLLSVLLTSQLCNAQSAYSNTTGTFVLDTLYTSTSLKEDKINISISNYEEQEKTFVVDVVTLDEGAAYWGTIYSAAINEDDYFFKQWRDTKKIAQKMKVRYILPSYGNTQHDIDAEEIKDFSFTIAGKTLQKGLAAKLRITVNDNQTIYSPVFYIYKQPE